MTKKLLEVLGADVLLDEVLRALTTEQKEDVLSYIARMHDIEVDVEE